jgi:uncharacterized membrane protein YeaQ/YmgE (transglycosylase-associated protein family)
MNIVSWVLAGGVLGWASLALLGMNEFRGVLVAIALGAAGGFVGGSVIAPMLSSPDPAPVGFNLFALFVAAVCAAGCLTLGNLIYKRFDV